MKVTAEQINHLYEFTNRHSVEYYDLQTELVDHLANAIEEQWETHPDVAFETALQIEFKKFGAGGFTKLVEQRKLALELKFNKIVWGFINEFFRLPLILATGTLIAVLPFLLGRDENVYLLVLLSLMFIHFIYESCLWVIRKVKKNKGDKKWLFKEVLQKHNPLAMSMIVWLFYSTNLRFGNKILEYVPFTIYSFIFSAFIVFYGLYLYVVDIVVPSKAEQYLKQTYPEYELSK